VPGYVAFESLTVAGTAVGLTAATYAENDVALITVDDAAVRFRLDGTAPTATVGHVLEPGDVLVLDSPDQLTKVRFIRRDGVSATLRVSYGR